MDRKSHGAQAVSSQPMFATAEFLNLEHTAHPKLFENQNYVWDALKQIASYLQFRLKPGVLGQLVGKPFLSNHVFIGRGTIVEQGAVLKGPAWIGENCQIRSGCYVRENVIVGDGVVMGNSCEFKNCILCDEAQVPHFNYVGDSILGFRAHLGAGVILSNVKLDHREISVAAADRTIPTGLTKFGAIIGSRASRTGFALTRFAILNRARTSAFFAPPRRPTKNRRWKSAARGTRLRSKRATAS